MKSPTKQGILQAAGGVAMFVIAVGAVACLLNWFVATIPPGPVGLLLLLLVLTIGALHCAVRCIALIIHILTRP